MPTLSNYTIDSIGQKWVDALTKQVELSIIIPSYKDKQYLDLCIESIKHCTTIPYELIVVDAENPRRNFSQAVNYGVSISKGKYIAILNSDLIVSKGWEKPLMTDNIMGVLSNCDLTFRHNYKINIKGVDLIPGANTLEQIKPIINDIYEFRSPYNEIKEVDWIAFYAVVMKRTIWNDVGKLDENFQSGCEDYCWCLRAIKMGYKFFHNFTSFIFHFGGRARGAYEKENTQYHNEDHVNHAYLTEKYSKPTVVLYSGLSYERWSHKNVETGIGGSELWQIYLADEFVKLGYRVVSFSDCPVNELHDGVQWLHYNHFKDWVNYNYADYFISSRTEDPFQYHIRSKKNFIQLHDVWMMSGQQVKYSDKITKYCALSDWHKSFAANYHNLPLEKFAIMQNGIDFDRFKSNVTRHAYRFHWSSSWDRGLDNVLYLWPFIKQQLPKAELHCFYGLHNWKSACEQRNDQAGLKKIAELEKLTKQDGVFTYGRIGQKELAIEIQKASVLFYPSWFSETFFITGIECQYAGVPVICNKYAGVTTTFKDSAIMLGNGDPWWPYSKEGREAFLTEVISLLKDRNKWKLWSDKGKQNAARYSWENAALKWKELFEK